MGTFMGHIMPGSILFALGLHWLISIFNSYFKLLHGKSGKKFQCSVTYKFPCFPNWPALEGYVIIVVTILGVIAQISKGIKGEFPFIATNCLQHISMYLFFTVNGVVDVLTAKGYRLPRNTDYAAAILAIINMSILFANHGHDGIHNIAHRYIVWLSMVFIVGAICELLYKEEVLGTLIRTFGCLSMGTWFLQTAFLLHSPFSNRYTWDIHNHEDVMMISFIFTLHLAFALCLIILIGYISYLKYSRPINLKDNLSDDDNYQKLLEDESSSVDVSMD